MATKSSGDTTKRTKRPAPLLPNLSISIIQGLIRIYGRLQGELDKAKDNRDALIEPAQSKELMGHIKGLMPLFGVDFDPSSVRTVRTRVRDSPLKHGQLRHGILLALKKNGGFMTYQEVLDFIIAKHRLTLSYKEQTLLLLRVKQALFFLMGLEEVERESEIPRGANDERQRFRLCAGKYRQ
jgi:hypothetical protein